MDVVGYPGVNNERYVREIWQTYKFLPFSKIPTQSLMGLWTLEGWWRHTDWVEFAGGSPIIVNGKVVGNTFILPMDKAVFEWNNIQAEGRDYWSQGDVTPSQTQIRKVVNQLSRSVMMDKLMWDFYCVLISLAMR